MPKRPFVRQPASPGVVSICKWLIYSVLCLAGILLEGGFVRLEGFGFVAHPDDFDARNSVACSDLFN
jgi:hypothetical protein